MFRLVRVSAACQFEVNGSVYDSLCVGRGSQNDLWTTDRLISTSHSRFFIRDATLQLVDLDSRNGTEVNGSRLTPFEPHELKDGDMVDVAGRIAFRVELDSDADYPVITIEEATEAERDDVLRVLALPEGLSPVLEATRLLGLHQVTAKLLDPQNQRQGTRWAEILLQRAARLLKVDDSVLILADGRHRWTYPERPDVPVREEALREAERRKRAVAVEVTAVELDDADGHSTLDTSGSGLAFVPIICAPIVVADRIRGYLYAPSEKVRRSFNDQDVWVAQALADVVAGILPMLSMQQIMTRHRATYRKLLSTAAEHGLVGRSVQLATVLELLASLADRPEPVMFECAPTECPERWAGLLHDVSRRSGAPFSVLDVSRIDDAATIQKALGAADGGMLLLESIDALDPSLHADLQALLDGGLATRVRVVLSSRYTPELLTGLRGFSPRLVAQMTRHCVRIPRIRERGEDLVDTVVAFAKEQEPATSAFFTADAVRRLREAQFDGGLKELESLVSAMLASSSVRPLERSHLEDPLAAYVRGPETSATRELPGFHPLAPAESKSAALVPLIADLDRAGLLDS